MPEPPYATVWDLPRNSLAACRHFWRSRDITAEEWRVMLRLQDDPQALIDAAEGWARKRREELARARK